LAPAGGFPATLEVVRLLKHPDLAGETRLALLRLFHISELSLCSSGKAALESICRHLSLEGKKRLLVAGYSCPDIVAAAVRAGFKVSPLDINPETLEIDQRAVDYDEKSDSVLLSNLYGLVDDAQWLAHSRWIDDGCQAALSTEQGRRIGSRSLGLISFGRGKAICGTGGGAALGLSDPENISGDSVFDLLKCAAFSWMERPSLYWLPASMPFLHLGETVYDPHYENRAPSRGQLAVALRQVEQIERTEAHLGLWATRWTEYLDGLPLILPAKLRAGRPGVTSRLIRFPVLFPDDSLRDRAYQNLHAAGLGASLSYPSALGKLCASESRFLARPTPGAEQAARRILTLPVHPYVQERDMERTRMILKQLCSA